MRVDLETLLAAAELAVPKMGPAMESWLPLPAGKQPGMHLRFGLYRDALSVRMNGPKLSVRTLAHYWAEVGFQAPGKAVKSMGVCGQGKEGRRQVILGTEAEVAFTPDWDLDVRTSVLPALAVNPCRFTSLDSDLTPQVVKGMEEELTKAGSALRSHLGTAARLRQRAEGAWDLLAQPLELAPGIHLSMNPERVRLAPLRTDGNVLVVVPGISARPRVTFGPAPRTHPDTLPPLDVGAGLHSPGFRIQLVADLPFDEATSQIARQLVGKDLRTEKGRQVITGARVRGDADGATIEVDLKGRVKGRLTLTGRPAVTVANSSLHLQGLDYTPASRSWIAKNGEWLVRSSLRELIQEHANFLMAQSLREAGEQVNRHLNRTLPSGLRLSGKPGAMVPNQPKVLADRFQVIATLEGELEATLTVPSEAAREEEPVQMY
jgi:hypothetical protein